MNENEQLQAQLTAHRAALAHLLTQQARFGGSHVPPQVALDIVDARAAIARLKTQLHERGVPVDDLINDHEDTERSVSRRTAWRSEARTAMLANVRRTWIDGVLYKSLWNDALLILRLSERPDAVRHPYGLHLRAADGDAPLPVGTTIQQVYDAQHGALLILGQPGSGKTTLLLELARTLLDRADADVTHPIPVVFNLTTWQERQSLAVWLIAQLNHEYSVPKKLGQAWIDAGIVLPLLDGLDEVAEDRRAACVRAINAYRTEHEATWLIPIVVCCRVREYEALPSLQLHNALEVQPLNHTEIDDYLRDGGRALAGVRGVVKDDPTLYELLETPLMLAITALTFAGKSAAELRRGVDATERRRTIFAAFVTRQFQPPPEGKDVDVRYGKTRTLRWLIYLGRQMHTRQESIFRADQIQPFWLDHWSKRALHMLSALFITLIGFLVVMLLIGFVVGWSIQPLGVLSVGVMSGIRAWLVMSLLAGFLAWLAFVITGMQYDVSLGKITLFEQIHWSWSGLWAGLAVWLTIGVATWWLQQPVATLIIGVVPALLLAFGIGFRAGQIPTTSRPYQGIQLSFQNAVRIGAMSATPVIITGLLIMVVVPTALFGGIIVSLFGLGLGLGVWGAKGGHDVVKHYTLRLLLWLSGTSPWHIAVFLDSCAQRRLVQRVGGGWRFPHNLIRDYFAELDVHAIDEPAE